MAPMAPMAPVDCTVSQHIGALQANASEPAHCASPCERLAFAHGAPFKRMPKTQKSRLKRLLGECSGTRKGAG